MWNDSYSGHRPYFTKETDEKYYWNEKHKSIPGELYFSEEEEMFGSNIILDAKKWWKKNKKNNFEKIVFIEPSRIKTIKSNSFENRNWGIDKWQSFIDNFKNEYLFIQSVFSGSDFLEGIYSFKSNFREACAVIKIPILLLNGGGFTHAAAATKTALFICGSYIDPKIIGIQHEISILILMVSCVKFVNIAKCNEIITVEMTSNF